MKSKNKIYLKDSMEVADLYLKIAQNDEKAAVELEKQKLYNQSAYFYIQAMEKQIKNYIARKIDITNKYYADQLKKTMGHSLEEALNLLLTVYCENDENLKLQISDQIVSQVLKGKDLKFLHNNVRYPTYKSSYKDYIFEEINAEDCQELNGMLQALKKYLIELQNRYMFF